MARDPYSVLGVSPGVNDDELKKAYRELVKKNHPDRFQDPELARVAEERMKEINAAYEEIQKMREQGGPYGNSGSQYGGSWGNQGNQYGGFGSSYTGGDSSYNGKYRELYSRVRVFINNNRAEEAEALLRTVDEYDRAAEWYYLEGCVLVIKGQYMGAGKCFDKACQMDPTNAEYANARRELRMKTSGQSGNWNSDPCGKDCGDLLSSCLRCCCWFRCCCC